MGIGCAEFYNYIDFCFRNDAETTFHLSLSIDEKNLNGHLTSDVMIEHSYKVFEKNHRFASRDGLIYKENEIWRKVSTRLIGEHVRDELLVENHIKVLYQPDEVEVEN